MMPRGASLSAGVLVNSKIVGEISGRLQERENFFYWAEGFLGIFYHDSIDRKSRIFYLEKRGR